MPDMINPVYPRAEMTLSGISGHKRARKILAGTIASGRISSAYLFTGPDGTGKKLAAFIFAKAMNCTGGKTSDFGGNFENTVNNQTSESGLPCGKCSSCRKVDSCVHPDLKVIYPDGNFIKVEAIREINAFLSLSPMEWDRHVLIVGEADKMNSSAANAFLKTLEEPPPNSVIILVSACEEDLADTIRSRCVRIAFKPIPPDELAGIASAMGLHVTDTHVRLSLGSVGALLSDRVVNKRDADLSVFSDMVQGKTQVQWKDNEEMESWFNSAIEFLRDMVLLKIDSGSDSGNLDSFSGNLLINADRREELSNLCKGTDIKVIIECYERLPVLMNSFVFNVNKKIVINYVQSILRSAFSKDARGRALAQGFPYVGERR
ncbi:MAG: DNA polymerase III subunit delta' [Nitrospirae bacterium]|nr:DNA polymerase III subunit delta' [Nitrospirota bacterium]